MNVLVSALPVIKYITTNERVDFYLNDPSATPLAWDPSATPLAWDPSAIPLAWDHKVFSTQPNVRKDISSYIKLVEYIGLLDKPVKGCDRLKFTEAHKELLKYTVYTSNNTGGFDNTRCFDNIRGKLMYRNVLGLKIIVE